MNTLLAPIPLSTFQLLPELDWDKLQASTFISKHRIYEKHKLLASHPRKKDKKILVSYERGPQNDGDRLKK